MEYQSLISIAPWTFIFQILNLLLQAYLFKRFLFQPIKKIIEKRQAEINGVYDEANKAKEDAEAAKADYEGKIQTARTEAEAITAGAVNSAKLRSEQIVEEANAQATAMREKAEKDIELERRKTMDELKGEIAGISVEIASKVVGKEIGEKEHEKLIDQFIEELGDGV